MQTFALISQEGFLVELLPQFNVKYSAKRI